MLHFDFQNFCCGCSACANCCPVHAITIETGADGFQYPKIWTEQCVDCGICEKVCPHLNGQNTAERADCLTDTWLYASGDRSAKLRSSSGGAFYELAKSVLEEDGYVVGCVWDDTLRAKHIVSQSMNDLQRMQGSKYVQSDMGSCIREILDLLDQGKQILFSGTPCQAAAMARAALALGGKNARERLITVGVICHGVASPAVWESYKDSLAARRGKLTAVNFRDKSQEGYKKSYCKLQFDNENDATYLPTFLPSLLPGVKNYIEATLVYNLGLRNSCTHCDCKGETQLCDIILGDWYAEYKGEGELGTSCITAFTLRGRDFVKGTLQRLRPFSFEDVKRGNCFICQSVVHGEKSEIFLKDLKLEIWDYIEDYYPSKHHLKRLLVRLKLFDVIKRLQTVLKNM